MAVLASGIAAPAPAVTQAPDSAPPTFTNPLLTPPAQDPQVIMHQGRYYYCESSSEGIFLRVSDDMLGLGKAARQCVWSPPSRGLMSKNIWAPELHSINGRCYIYFAADDGQNENHRMWVLACKSDNPLDGYELVGTLDTQGWAIDGTVFATDDGTHYFVWSGWPGSTNGQQNLYIAKMKSPTELTGGRVLIGSPTQAWERKGMPICEGPQILRRGGRTFLVYSASGSWTPDYCLGMMVHRGGDILDRRNWSKVGAVFLPNNFAWGVGHCGFITSDDGRENWILYHAKTSRRLGWEDREVRAQPFYWAAENFPVFGEPLARSTPLPMPGQLKPALLGPGVDRPMLAATHPAPIR